MSYKNIINKFKNKRILVVGDVMLDKYVQGKVNRISPEAPVPVLTKKNVNYKLGGAANVADNITALGGKAFLCGSIGQDAESQIILDLCNKRSINTTYLTRNKKQSTTIKTRFVTDSQQILRYDEDANCSEAILPNKTFDAIIISDYNKGTITLDLAHKIRKCNTVTVVDPHPGRTPETHTELFRDFTVLKPNIKEAEILAGWKYETEEDLQPIFVALKKKYKSDVIISMGNKGLAIMQNGTVKRIPTQVREVYDVSGAGDTVTAALTLALTTKASAYEAAVIANKAAGIVVEKFGTATANTNELMSTISENTKIKTVQEIILISEQLRKEGKTVVFTNGCFDILHKLHYHLLRDSKQHGDVLVVGLNTDASIKKLKGNKRPYINQKDRAELLSGFECVDYITFFGTPTPLDLIKKIRPDTITKGGDYTHQTICGHKYMKQINGKTVIIPYNKDYSTKNIIKKIGEQK